MDDIFWKSIADYNTATWPLQILFIAVAAVLTLILWFRPRTWAKIAMKVYMVAVSLWIAFVYYMKYAAVRDYSEVIAIFWCMVAAAWIYDLLTHFASFQKPDRCSPWRISFLFLPLLYPVISLARGLEFPMITTPMLPSAVALYMLGMLLVFSRRINLFVFIFIVHWSVIAISKIVFFDIPEDILLAAACLPAIYVFFSRMVEEDRTEYKPSRTAVKALVLAVAVLIGTCMVVEYV